MQVMYGEPVYHTVEEVKNLLQEYITEYITGYTYRRAVIEKESGECIGQVAYFLVDGHGSWGGEILKENDEGNGLCLTNI